MRTSVLFQNTMGASAVAIAATLAMSPLLCSMSNGNEQDGDGGAAKEPAEGAAEVADADLEDAGDRSGNDSGQGADGNETLDAGEGNDTLKDGDADEAEQPGSNGHDVVAEAEDQDAAAVKPESTEDREGE